MSKNRTNNMYMCKIKAIEKKICIQIRNIEPSTINDKTCTFFLEGLTAMISTTCPSVTQYNHATKHFSMIYTTQFETAINHNTGIYMIYGESRFVTNVHTATILTH